MFGYVKVLAPELLVKEYDCYKAFYCGLCGACGKRYGPFARLTLSYDLTFLAIVFSALNNECADISPFRCKVNPTRKKFYVHQSKSLNQCADISVILSYYSLWDKIKDPGINAKLSALVLLPFFCYMRRRALKKYNLEHLDKSIAKELMELMALEKTNGSLDECAATFGNLIANIMTEEFEDLNGDLKTFGFHLGRWIYMIDAIDDLQEDIKQGAFNPVITQYDIAKDIKDLKSEDKAELNYTLILSLNESKKALYSLPLYRYKNIIDNVLTYGMTKVKDDLLFGKERHETKR